MEITSLDQLDLNKTYSYADYLLWKFQERVELFRGKILKMSPAPNRKHQEVAGALFLEMGLLFRNKPCRVYISPFDVRLPRKSKKDQEIFTVVQPDLCIICDREKLDEKGCVGAPDLIIEILSPGNSKREMKDKYQLYEEAGVREYWIIDPNQESVLINILENGKYKNQYPIIDDEVVSHIFPNIKIHTNEIFNME